MPLYLKSSKTLYCFFDKQWLSRLWCVWELGVYQKMREKPNVLFLSLDQKMIETCLVIIVLTQNLLCDIPNIIGTEVNISVDVVQIFKFVLSLLSHLLIFFFGQRHFRANQSLRKAMPNYDIRNGELTDERDRALLLDHVGELFDDGEVEVSRLFDDENTVESPVSVSPKDGSKIGAGKSRGLDAFNKSLRKLATSIVPESNDARSCIILSYIPVILSYSYEIFGAYDTFSFSRNWYLISQASSKVLLLFAWKFFVFGPFNNYLQNCLIRACLWCQGRERSDRIPWQIGLVLYLVVDGLLGIRRYLNDLFYGMVLGATFSSPISGESKFINASFMTHLITVPIYFVPVIWLGVIIITLFTFYCYAPAWCRKTAFENELIASFWKRFTRSICVYTNTLIIS